MCVHVTVAVNASCAGQDSSARVRRAFVHNIVLQLTRAVRATQQLCTGNIDGKCATVGGVLSETVTTVSIRIMPRLFTCQRCVLILVNNETLESDIGFFWPKNQNIGHWPFYLNRPNSNC